MRPVSPSCDLTFTAISVGAIVVLALVMVALIVLLLDMVVFHLKERRWPPH